MKKQHPQAIYSTYILCCPVQCLFCAAEVPGAVCTHSTPFTCSFLLRLLYVFLLQVALGVMGATVRKLLKLYRGYECKEPEPGKFTLAFQ